MKILVTGGLGFIGGHFIRYWIEKHPKDFIYNLDSVTYAANPESLRALEGNPRYNFIKGDICDPVLVDNIMKEVDVVIHFAAESHVDRSLSDPESFVRTNVMGTFNLLRSAQKFGVWRFHHISTDEVFGALPLDTGDKFNENTKYDPRSPYSASKASSDHFVQAYSHSFNLPVTITNCSNNYGPFQSPEKFIPRMITNLLEDKKVPIYGDGLYVRDWLHVLDHCRAIEAVVIHGKPGDTYNVGGLTEDIPNIEVARTILRLMGKDESFFEYVPDRPGHDRRYAVDWTKISHELGWAPIYTFEQGIKETVEWYQSNQSWWKTLKQEAENFYTNKKQIEKISETKQPEKFDISKLPLTPNHTISTTFIEGVYTILPKVYGDQRGWYLPNIEMSILEAIRNYTCKPVQIATSYNQQPGVLRGLHYQKPNTQGKLVWVQSGSVLDVAVDIRKGSPTFGKYIAVKLTASEHNQLWVPPGMAHGYIALEADTCFAYLVTDGTYDPSSEKGVNPFDPEIGIDWLIPREKIIIKDRDLKLPLLNNINQEDLL